MAALGAQSIASSYEQLLHVDADGGGNTTTHVSVKDGDNGTTFALTLATDAVMITSTNRLEFGDTGTYIHQSADGVLDLVSDTEIEINATTIDINGAVDISGNTTLNGGTVTLAVDTDFVTSGGVNGMSIDGTTFSVDGANNRIGVGIAAPLQPLHVEGNVRLGDTYSVGWGGVQSQIVGSNASDYLDFQTTATSRLRIASSGLVGIGETANAGTTIGLTINQAANDNEILAFKSSDVAHGMTDITETDTYGFIKKKSGTAGGLKIVGLSDSGTDAAMFLDGVAGAAADTTKSSSGVGIVKISGTVKDGTDATATGSDGNLCSIGNGGTTRFIFDAEGSFHADVESTTFDAYDDAQLVRAYDLSHGKGMIESQFDQFIDYNHETLAELKLVGREEDGTPNRMVNVTGMQHLHNGAIWQQYTEMQKMKELMYDTMVEMLGKEKADQKLTDHDIKLLDNKTLLN